MHAVKTEAFLTDKNLTKENTLTGKSTAVHKRSLLKYIFVINHSVKRRTIDLLVIITGDIPGAPNENKFQNHLNIALLNVF